MFEISIVHSDDRMINRLASLIQNYFSEKEIQSEIRSYHDGKTFLEDGKNTDLLIVDCSSEDYNGTEVAMTFRERFLDKSIIFLIDTEENAIKGYSFFANGCLLKHIEEKMLRFYLRKAYYKKKKEDLKKLFVKTKDGLVVIPHEDIAYVEIRCHTILIHLLKNGKPCSVSTRGCLREYEEFLYDKGFVKSCNYALVNLKYVSQVKSKFVYLAKIKRELPISLSNKEQFMKSVVRYLSISSAPSSKVMRV